MEVFFFLCPPPYHKTTYPVITGKEISREREREKIELPQRTHLVIVYFSYYFTEANRCLIMNSEHENNEQENNPQMEPRTPCILALKNLLSHEDMLFLGFRTSDNINPIDQTGEIANVTKFLMCIIPKAQVIKRKSR